VRYFLPLPQGVLLNGIAGDPIRHGRGFRQGDPLLLLLFVMAIDPLRHILRKATEQGHRHKLPGRSPTIRTSLYVNNATMFVSPDKNDINCMAATLTQVGDATGFVTPNCAKSQVAPIRCESIDDLDDIRQAFPATRTSFPMKYLGLLLLVCCLKSMIV
jgi:hypothetical protein